MNKKISTLISFTILVFGFIGFNFSSVNAKSTSGIIMVQQQAVMQSTLNPMDVAKNPQKYLNKRFRMNVTFDKFSTLGLDYKPVKRDHNKYIGFLIQRNDVIDHNIPFSEMKLFLKREYAKQFAELDTGDKLEVTGTMFSTALGDPWIDVEKIIVKQKVKKEEK